MKKQLCFILILFITLSLNSAGSSELFSTIGSEYAYLAGEQKNSDFNGFITDEFGIFLGFSCFPKNKPVGLHARVVLQIPIKGEFKFNNTDEYIIDLDSTKAKTVILGRSMIGPIYRLQLSPRTNFFLNIGLGLRAYETIYQSNENNIYLLYTSLSSDIGFNHYINKAMFLQFGINFDYDSTAHTGSDLIIGPFFGLGIKY